MLKRSSISFRKCNKALIVISPSWLLMVLRLPHTACGTGKSPVDLSTAIIQVAKKNVPAVVHIEVTGQQEVTFLPLPFSDDPFFRRFLACHRSHGNSKDKGVGTEQSLTAGDTSSPTIMLSGMQPRLMCCYQMEVHFKPNSLDLILKQTLQLLRYLQKNSFLM